jgi:two-component system response regulator PhoP
MWILLIEDEARLRSSLKQGLEEEGYVVDQAADGEAGLDEARAWLRRSRRGLAASPP